MEIGHPSPAARAISKNPRPDDYGPDGSRDALTGRCETFDCDGCRYDSHGAQVHDPDDQKDRHQTGTAVAAVESEAQALWRCWPSARVSNREHR